MCYLPRKINKEGKKENENNNILNNIEEDATEALLVKENKEEQVSVLECGHMFHSNCIEKWLKNKKECPLCRQKINPKYNEMMLKWYGVFKMKYIIIDLII